MKGILAEMYLPYIVGGGSIIGISKHASTAERALRKLKQRVLTRAVDAPARAVWKGPQNIQKRTLSPDSATGINLNRGKPTTNPTITIRNNGIDPLDVRAAVKSYIPYTTRTTPLVRDRIPRQPTPVVPPNKTVPPPAQPVAAAAPKVTPPPPTIAASPVTPQAPIGTPPPPTIAASPVTPQASTGSPVGYALGGAALGGLASAAYIGNRNDNRYRV
jgi:hypothetical protein